MNIAEILGAQLNLNNPINSLPYYIRGAFRGFETALARYLAAYDMPLSHFYILRLQWGDGGHSQKNIAERAFMTESVASQVIKAMVKAGHLVREKDPEDSRRHLVGLSQFGAKLRKQILDDGISISQKNAPKFSPEDIRTTMAVLLEVQQAFDVYNSRKRD